MRRITAVLLTVILVMLGSMAMPAMAQTVEADALSITLTTDKEAYEKGEKIHATLTVENESEAAVEGISVAWKTPALCAADKELRNERSIARIADGESKTMEMTFTVTGNPGALEGEEGEDPQETLPRTGDESNVLLWAALLALSVFALLKLDPKSRKRLTALVLCAALSMSLLPAGAVSSAKADDEDLHTITVKEEISILGRKINVEAQVSYRLSDEAQVAEEEENEENPDLNSTLAEGDITGYGLTATSVMLSWKAVEGAQGYEIHRGLKLMGAFEKVLDTAETSAQVPAVQKKLNYFKIRAYTTGEDGNRVYGEFMEPFGIFPLEPVTGLSASLDKSNRVMLTWNKVKNAKKYELYYSRTEKGSYALYGAVSGNKLALTDLPEDIQDIYLKLVATRVDSKITSRSAESNVLAYCMIDAPQNVTGSAAGSGKVKLSWTAAPGAEGYEVYVNAKKSGTFTKCAETAQTQTEIAVEEKPIWYFKVRSYVERAGARIYSGYTDAFALYCLETPQELKVGRNKKTNDLELSWKKVKNAQTYDIEYSANAEGPYTLYGNVKSAKATLSELPHDLSEVHFRVIAVRQEKETKFVSAPAQTGYRVLWSPENLDGELLESGKVKLSWSAATGADGYEIYANTKSSGKFKLCAETTQTEMEISIEDKPVWYFKVKTYAQFGEERIYSEETEAIALYRLDAPGSLKISRNKKTNALELSWKKVKNAQTYDIEYSTNEDGPYTLHSNVKATKATLDGVGQELGETYFRVSAVREEGGKTFKGEPAQVNYWIVGKAENVTGAGTAADKVRLAWWSNV